MTRLAYAAALLIIAAFLAALAVILARPRWRWEPEERELCREPGCWATLGHSGPHGVTDNATTGYPPCDESCRVITNRGTLRNSTGSPESVTWSVDNGEGLFV